MITNSRLGPMSWMLTRIFTDKTTCLCSCLCRTFSRWKPRRSWRTSCWNTERTSSTPWELRWTGWRKSSKYWNIHFFAILVCCLSHAVTECSRKSHKIWEWLYFFLHHETLLVPKEVMALDRRRITSIVMFNTFFVKLGLICSSLKYIFVT